MSELMLIIWSAMLTFFGAGLGWLINRIHKMLDDLRQEDTNIRNDMHNTCVRRDDYLRSNEQILTDLKYIRETLDKKQDRRGRR